MKKENLESRREFFKNAAKKALPILAISLLGPSVLSSCGEDEPDDPSGSGGGSKRCGGMCSANCRNECRGNAAYAPASCKSGCKGACLSTCKTSCYHTSKAA